MTEQLELDDIENKLIPVYSYTDLSALSNKDQKINELCAEINTLKELFHDLNSLVVHDGKQINVAHENIQNTKSNVEKAEHELVSTDDYKTKNTILAGIILTLVAGPSIGVIAGVKAGVAVFLGTSGITYMYKKINTK